MATAKTHALNAFQTVCEQYKEAIMEILNSRFLRYIDSKELFFCICQNKGKVIVHDEIDQPLSCPVDPYKNTVYRKYLKFSGRHVYTNR